MAKFKMPQIRIGKKQLDLIRLSVLKELTGTIANPEFLDDLAQKANVNGGGSLYANDVPNSPKGLPENFIDAYEAGSGAYRHLILYIIKVGEYLSNLFIYNNKDYDYREAEHLFYRNGRVYNIKYNGKIIPVSGMKDEEKGTLTVESERYKHLNGTIISKGEFTEHRNNYQGIGDLWLLYDVMRFIAMEYNELKINSLLTRERLAIAGAGPEGQKMINNIIRALFDGAPVINFDNVLVIERILKGGTDKNGKISFENRIEKLIMSYKHANSILARDAYIPYNDSNNKKERVNMAETNMENIYVGSMLDSRLKFRQDMCTEIKEVFNVEITVSINKEVKGDKVMENVDKAKENTPNEI